VRDAARTGILLHGQVSEAHLTGNVVTGARLSGLQFQEAGETADVLVANNTFFNCAWSIRNWSPNVAGQRIELAGNLILSKAQPDMLFVDGGALDVQPRGPGNLALLDENWTMRNNWRETTTPTGEGIVAKAWIPPDAADTLQEDIEVMTRDPDRADFLRPAADSPLATGGVGGDLPVYVGARPPEGAEAWDWQKTWTSRYP
jgi:hypothetical protein